MEKFIDKTQHIKITKMVVKVYDLGGNLINSYETPEGLQLGKYVASLYPEYNIITYLEPTMLKISKFSSIPSHKIIVEVLNNNILVEKHIGSPLSKY